MKAAAIYVRISKDGDGEGLGIKRQEEDGRALAKRKGWTVAGVYRDNDISAVKFRPRWEQMLRDISNGELGAVIAYSSSRLYRDVDGDKARLFAACLEQDQNGDRVQVETVVSGTIDPYTADGRMLANILASIDTGERERTSERLRRMMQDKRTKGEWIGRPPYGFRIVGKHLERNEDELAILENAARRYIDGEAMYAIAEDIGFKRSPLAKMLHSSRVHEALPDDVSGPLAEALLARKFDRVPTSKRSLLGGLARCGVCGGGLSLSSSRGGRERGPWFAYRCAKSGHVGIAGQWLEDHVVEQVLNAVDADRILALQKKAKVRSRRVSELEARLAHLDESYASGSVTRSRFDRMNASLVKQLAEAQEGERANGVSLPVEIARNLAQRWPDMPRDLQRKVIAGATKTITVAKAEWHGPVDPARVKIAWRS